MMASENSSSLQPHSCPEYTNVHTYTWNNPLLSIAPPWSQPSSPRTFDQSESDVIAKVAGGCYIPEAVVCGGQLQHPGQALLAAPTMPPGHRLNPALCGARTHQRRASGDRADKNFPSDS